MTAPRRVLGLVLLVAACASPAASVPVDDWSRHDLGPDVPPLVAVVRAGDGFLAVGGLDPQAGSTIWSSADGLAWEQVATTDDPLADVVAGGPGFVAIASQGGAVWLSEDGRSWSEAPPDPDLAGAVLQAVAEVGGRLVAVGRTGIVISTDGLDWQPVGLPGGQGVVYDVAATDHGLIAVGSVLVGSMEGKGIIWTSSDGLVWERLPDDPAFERAEIFRVTSMGDRVVATGYGPSVERGLFAMPTAWTSADGRSWRRAVVNDDHLPVRAPLGSGQAGDLEGAIMGPVRPTSNGWISAGQAWEFRDGATGPSGPRGAFGDLAIWTSADGASWRRVAPHRRFELGVSDSLNFGGPTEIIAIDDRVFVYGWAAGSGIVWTTPAASGGSEPPPRSIPGAPAGSSSTP
jgi:hypothetical protein